MMDPLSFSVVGRPQTAGSKVSVPTAGGPRVIESGSKESRLAKRTWRGDLRDAALSAIGDREGWPADGPMAVNVVFAFHRPKTHYGTGRNERVVKYSAPASHCQDPDVSKVWRAAEDALTGIVWTDDNRIVEQFVVKVWADRFSEDEGVSIMVRQLVPAPDLLFAP